MRNFLVLVTVLFPALSALGATVTWTNPYRDIDAFSDFKTSTAEGTWAVTASGATGSPGDLNYATASASHTSTLDASGVAFTGTVSRSIPSSGATDPRAAIDSNFTVSADSQWRFQGEGLASGTFITMSIYDLTDSRYIAQSSPSPILSFSFDETLMLTAGHQYAVAVKVMGGGSGSLTASLSEVPEPGTLILLAATVAPFATRRTPRRLLA